MINNIVRKCLIRNLSANIVYSYGELKYTQTINHQNAFDKIPTYRLIDLDGKLLDQKHQYDL